MSTPAQVGTNCWVARYGDANNAAATPADNDPARPEPGSLQAERLPLEGHDDGTFDLGLTSTARCLEPHQMRWMTALGTEGSTVQNGPDGS